MPIDPPWPSSRFRTGGLFSADNIATDNIANIIARLLRALGILVCRVSRSLEVPYETIFDADDTAGRWWVAYLRGFILGFPGSGPVF